MKHLITFLVATVVAITAWAGDVVEVTGTNVRLRIEPNLNGAIYKDSKGSPVYPAKGEKLEYLGESGDFYKVTFNGKQLFISKQFTRKLSVPAKQAKQVNTPVKTATVPDGTVKQADKGKAPAASTAPTAVIVTGQNVRLRAGASLKAAILKDGKGNNLHPDKGQRLQCTGMQGDFYRVVYNGLTAFISKQYATPAE